MVFISITRLRIRSWRFLPAFALHTWRSLRQVQAAPGFAGGSILADRRWTFWTMTSWDGAESMRAYRNTAAHKAAMPKLLDWCDEASLVHWDQPAQELPSWTEADRRMRTEGRVSKVRHPSEQHAAMIFHTPRLTASGPIRPARS